MSGIPRPASAARTPEPRLATIPSSASSSSFASAREEPTAPPPPPTFNPHSNSNAVRVAARIRPLTSDDQSAIPPRWQRTAVLAGSPVRVRVDPSPGTAPASPASSAAAAASADYIYDRAFAPDAGQAAVYTESVQPFVSKLFDGYNATVLTYGQSSSGKSYTMGTVPADLSLPGPHPAAWPPDTGIIPRTVADIFDRIQHDTRPGSYAVSVSFIELYNEGLIDLLAHSDRPDELRPHIQIRQEKGQIFWSGMNDVQVQGIADALALLTQGNTIRRTHQTDKNSQSSRSHAIFSLTLVHKHPTTSSTSPATSPASPPHRRPSAPPISASASPVDATRPTSPASGPTSPKSRSAIPRPQSALSHASSFFSPVSKHRSMSPLHVAGQSPTAADGDWTTTTSKFHFVDLASSERLKRNRSQDDRTKEGISINSDLHALGNVISALGDVSRGKATHVPYRDSKLTRLLQDSLGGNAYTLMIACVSPIEYNLSETINTLQYAARARAIRNSPGINGREPNRDDLGHTQALKTNLHHSLCDVARDQSPKSSVNQECSYAADEEAQATIRRLQKQLAATAQELALLKSGKAQGFSSQTTEPALPENEKPTDVLVSQVNLLNASLSHSGMVIHELEEQVVSQEQYSAEQEAISRAQQKRIDALEAQINSSMTLLPSDALEPESHVIPNHNMDASFSQENEVSLHDEMKELRSKYASAMAELGTAQAAHQETLQRAELLAAQLAETARPPAPRSRNVSGDDPLEVLSGSMTEHEDAPSFLMRRNSTGTRREKTWHPVVRTRPRTDADSNGFVSVPASPVRSKEPASSPSGKVVRRSSLTMTRSAPLISLSSGDGMGSHPASRAHQRSSSSIAYRPPDSPATARDLNDVTPSSRQTSPDDPVVPRRHSRSGSGSSQVGRRPLSLIDTSGARSDGAHALAAAAEEAQRKIRSLERERDTLQELLFQREDELDGLQRTLDSPATRTSISSAIADESLVLGYNDSPSFPASTTHVQELMAQLAAQENQHKDKVAAQLAEQSVVHAEALAKRDEAAATLVQAHLALQEQYAIAQVTATEATEQADAAKAQVAQLEAQLEAAKVEHEEALAAQDQQHKTALSGAEEAHARALSELNDRGDSVNTAAALKALREEHSAELQRRQDAHAQEMEALSLSHSDRLAGQDAASKMKVASLEEAQRSAFRDLEQLRAEHAGARATHAVEVNQRETQLRRLSEENASLRQAVDEARATSSRYESRVAQLAAQVDVDPVEMDMLKAELAETSDALVVLEGALTEAQAERDQAARELAHLRGDSSPTSVGGTIRDYVAGTQGQNWLARELEKQRELLAESRSDLSRVRAELQASQAECARNATLLRDAQHRSSQLERAATHRSAGWTQRSLFDDPGSGRVTSWDTANSHHTTLSSSSGKAPPPPPTPPPAGPPPPTPNGVPATTLNRPSSLAESVSSLSAGHGPNNVGPSPGVSPVVTIPVDERQKTLDEVNRLQTRLTHAEAESHASSDLVATLEAALNDSERNLRKARTQLSEVTRERDAFSAQSAELQAQLEVATEEVVKAQSCVTEQRQALEKEIEQERAARDKARQALSARLEEVTKRKSSRLFCI